MESVTIPFENPKDKPPVATPAVGTPETPVAPAPAGQSAAPVVPSAENPPEAGAPAAEPQSNPEAILQPYQQELATKGTLSEESLQKLAQDLGAPRELVDYTYKGMLAVRQERDTSIIESAGGIDSYKEMVGWATGVYTPEEAQAFNESLVSGTKDEAIAAVRALRQKFTAVNGSPKAEQKQLQTPPAPTVPVRGPQQVSSATEVKPFASLSELMEAQRDPRYLKNKEYTDNVYLRAMISKI